MSRKIVPSKLNGDLMGELAPAICSENNRERALHLIRTILPSAIYEGTRDYLYAEFVTSPDESLPSSTPLLRHNDRVVSIFNDPRDRNSLNTTANKPVANEQEEQPAVLRYDCPETLQDVKANVLDVCCTRHFVGDVERCTYAVDCECGFTHVVDVGEIVLESFAQYSRYLAKRAYPPQPIVLAQEAYTGPQEPITYQDLVKVRNLTPAELSEIASEL